jgi:ubiquitin C-terminal hydrolase
MYYEIEQTMTPEEEIKLKTGKILKLYSIIVQQGINSGGHYICLYNCNDLWYEYDDLGPQITPIGTFDKIINNTNEEKYLNNCTDLLYIEKTE